MCAAPAATESPARQPLSSALPACLLVHSPPLPPPAIRGSVHAGVAPQPLWWPSALGGGATPGCAAERPCFEVLLTPRRQWSDLEPGTRPSRAAHYRGWQASQAAIEAALVQHAPIDGLLGFSQGATATALFLAGASLPDQPAQQQPEAQQQRPDECDAAAVAAALERLRFAVVIAGFLPRDASYAAALQAGRPALPSLHVVGEKDALVPEERSAALWGCFSPGGLHIYRHPGAHMVPTCSGEFKQALVSLLDDVKAGRLARQQQQAQQQLGVHGSPVAASDEAAEAVAALAVG